MTKSNFMLRDALSRYTSIRSSSASGTATDRAAARQLRPQAVMRCFLSDHDILTLFKTFSTPYTGNRVFHTLFITGQLPVPSESMRFFPQNFTPVENHVDNC